MGESTNSPAAPPSVPKDKQDALQKLDASEKEQVATLQKVFAPHVDSPSLDGEVGKGDVQKAAAEQEKGVKDNYAKARDVIAQKVEAGAESKEQREVILTQVVTDAETAAKFRIKNVELILKAIVQGDHITLEEAEQLKRRLAGVEKIAATDIQTQNILAKLQQGSHQGLDATDYAHIIKLMSDPKDANFEASVAGMLIGLMNAKERARLIQEVMKSPEKRKEAPKIIDAFLSLGLITIRKGEDLFQEAINLGGILTQKEYDDQYKTKIDDGTYLNSAAQIREAIQTELSRMHGKYGNSMVERSFGMLPGFIGIVHSVLWIATNTLASGGNFAEMFKKNPYMLAAIAEFGISLDSFTGAMTIGGGVGNGVISRTVQRFMAKEGPQTTEKKEAYEKLTTIYCNYPQFGKYLANGGIEKLAEARKMQLDKGVKEEEIKLTVKDLLAVETDEAQKAKLTYSEQHFPATTMAQIAEMESVVKVLEIKKQADFQSKLAVIHEEQDISATPSTTKA